MLRGYRVLLFAACVGLAIVAAGFGYLVAASNYPEQERYQPYRYAPDKPLEVDPSAEGPANPQPFQYRAPCDEPKGQNESDLCAQWKAARAAEVNALWAKRDFWVGVASVIGLGLTIILTLRATEAAQRSAEAAEKAVEGSERPHLLLDKCEIKFPTGDANEKTKLTYSFTNHGKGPCWIRGAAYHLRTQDAKDKPPEDIDIKPTNGNPWAVPPGGRYYSLKPIEIDISKDTLEPVIDGSDTLYLFWAIRYTDSDDRSHNHYFGLMMVDPDAPRFIPVETKFWEYT